MPGPTPRVYKTSEIKSRLLNVARPSTYMVKFTPPPAVQSFIAQRGTSKGDDDGNGDRNGDGMLEATAEIEPAIENDKKFN